MGSFLLFFKLKSTFREADFWGRMTSFGGRFSSFF